MTSPVYKHIYTVRCCIVSIQNQQGKNLSAARERAPCNQFTASSSSTICSFLNIYTCSQLRYVTWRLFFSFFKSPICPILQQDEACPCTAFTTCIVPWKPAPLTSEWRKKVHGVFRVWSSVEKRGQSWTPAFPGSNHLLYLQGWQAQRLDFATSKLTVFLIPPKLQIQFYTTRIDVHLYDSWKCVLSPIWWYDHHGKNSTSSWIWTFWTCDVTEMETWSPLAEVTLIELGATCGHERNADCSWTVWQQ